MDDPGQSGVDRPEGSSSLSKIRTETSELRKVQRADLKLGEKIIPSFTYLVYWIIIAHKSDI